MLHNVHFYMYTYVTTDVYPSLDAAVFFVEYILS